MNDENEKIVYDDLIDDYEDLPDLPEKAKDEVAPPEISPEEEQKLIDESSSFIETMYEFTSVMVTALVAIAFIFTFLFRLVGVTGSSMQNTLHEGDWLMVKTYYKEPQYKDIVIITQPNYFHEALVKRVIAVGGQTVDIDFENGIVYIDGVPLQEDYIKELTKRHGIDTVEFPLIVPPGYVFVMGDNRNNSTDSRSEKVGLIKNEYLLGKAVGRPFPFKATWKIYD